MKRYYFDLSGGRWGPDQVGTDFIDDATARCAAIRFAGEILKSEPHCLTGGPVRIDVHDREFATRFAIVVHLKDC